MPGPIYTAGRYPLTSDVVSGGGTIQGPSPSTVSTASGSDATGIAAQRGRTKLLSQPPTTPLIVEDPSAPVAVTNGTNTATTASFTPVDNSLIVAISVAGNTDGLSQITAPVTDSLGSTWTLLRRANAATNAGAAEVWVMDAGASPAARTVTVTGTGSAAAVGVALTVKVLTGARPAAQQIGATAVLVSNTFTISLTTTTVDALVVGGLVDIVVQGPLTGNVNTTAWQTVSDAPNTERYGIFRSATPVTTPGATLYGFTALAADNQTKVAVEILPAGIRVTGASANSTGNATYSVALPAGCLAGDVLVVTGASQGTHVTNGMSVTDSVNGGGVFYTTILETQGGSASSRWLQSFVYQTTVNLPAGTTINFTPYALSTANAFVVDVYRGFTSTIAQAAVGSSNASATTSAAPALAAAPAAGALVLTFCQAGSGTLTPDTAFVKGSSNTANNAVADGYVIADGASTYGSTWTLGTANTSSAQTVALAAAASGAVTGSATLSGQSSLTAVGSNTVFASAALSAQSSMTTVPTVTTFGIAVLSAQSSLTVVGAVVLNGIAALSAQSTLTAVGSNTVVALSALSSQSTLTAVPSVTVPAFASLSIQSSLTALAKLTIAGIAAFSSQSTLTAVPSVTVLALSVQSANLNLVTVGTVIGSGPSAVLTIQSSLTVTALVSTTGIAALSAQSTLVTVATPIVLATVALSGQSSLVALAKLTIPGIVALSSQSTLTVVGTRIVLGIAALGGQSTLTVVPSLTVIALAPLSSQSNLIVVGSNTVKGFVALAADVSLAALATLTIRGFSVLSGQSTMVVSGGTFNTITGTVVLTLQSGLIVVANTSPPWAWRLIEADSDTTTSNDSTSDTSGWDGSSDVNAGHEGLLIVTGMEGA